MEPIINVDNVTIQFNLATQRVDSLKEYFVRLLKHQLMFQSFFPLVDINLKVMPGDSWGIIGVNGAGKSTFLKMVSGILKPYKGKVTIGGTIAPLIELGAGFDGDLTARENIFLNGAILGHSHKFMEAHFDEIVEFAELKDFLDVPIKNFSSGMQARLGFSLATMVKPDILIVDEILSVGDMAFQKKCELRINELLSGGTTLLFVSHSLDQVRRLCKQALWLEDHHAKMQGNSKEVCDAYEAREDVCIAKEQAVHG
jgi:lipopolysaccharide transport system ATP-binding protein